MSSENTSVKMVKTYGEKPIIFSLEENGEQYMIGGEVSQFSLDDLM